MSRRFAKLFEILGVPTGNCYIRYVRGTRSYSFLIPYDVEVRRGGMVGSIVALETGEGKQDWFSFSLSEVDLVRMITADKVSSEIYFSLDKERGLLPEVVFCGVCLVQSRWYLSKNVLNIARRASKKCRYPQWIELICRTAKGGQRAGIPKKRDLSLSFSKEEEERLESLVRNYSTIVENCIRHDWVEEYCQLCKDVAKYKGEKPLSRRKMIENFTELRGKFLNKD